MFGAPEKRNEGDAWRCLFEHLQAFGGEFVLQERDTGGVAIRPCKTCRKTEPHRIGAHRVNDRYCLRRFAQKRRDVSTKGERHIRFRTNQLLSEVGKPVRLTLCVTVFNIDVLSIDIAEVANR